MRTHKVLGIIGAMVVIFALPVQAQNDFCQQRQFYTLGDVNSDSAIDLDDIVYLVRFIFGTGPAPLPDFRSADINLDNKITLGDVIRIVKAWTGQSGVTLKLLYQNACCNMFSCGYPCDTAYCDSAYPVVSGKIRVFWQGILVSENFTDSSGNTLLVLSAGIYDLVLLPQNGKIDTSLKGIDVKSSRVDLGNKISIDIYVDQEVGLVYDTTYGWERLGQILDSIGVTEWVHFIPGHPEWILFKSPECLHVEEALNT